MIKVIAFDRGNVCGYYNFTVFDNFLKINGCNYKNQKQYFEKYKSNFDTDKITEQNFWEGLKEMVGFEGSWKLLAKNNQKNLVIDTNILKLIKTLRKNYTVILWSNTDKTSTRQFKSEIKLRDYFNGEYLSWKYKTLKVDKLVLDTIINNYKCIESEILFIDDFVGNINKMKELGAKGIVYEKLKKLKRDLKTMKIL